MWLLAASTKRPQTAPLALIAQWPLLVTAGTLSLSLAPPPLPLPCCMRTRSLEFLRILTYYEHNGYSQ